MRQTLRPLVAEFLGTFLFVFAGVGAIVTNVLRDGSVGLLGIAAAFGLALAVGTSATMHISGGHLNPAITIGAWSVGRIGWRDALLYIVAQLVGGIAAAFAVKGLYPEMAVLHGQVGLPSLSPQIGLAQGILIEFILTFALAFVMMATVVDRAATRVGGMGVGLTYAFAMLAGGLITGAALNPARALGSALAANIWTAQAAWWIGPILGGVAAFQVYERLLLKQDA
jgi:aquaporin Z